MAPNYLAYLNNPWADRYWRIGGEEIIDPHGPIAAGITRGVVRADPQPEPWRVAVGQLVHAAQARDLAGKLPKGLQEQVVKSSTAAIADILDDWCGTPPRNGRGRGRDRLPGCGRSSPSFRWSLIRFPRAVCVTAYSTSPPRRCKREAGLADL